jgi:hypothetical protein
MELQLNFFANSSAVSKFGICSLVTLQFCIILLFGFGFCFNPLHALFDARQYIGAFASHAFASRQQNAHKAASPQYAPHETHGAALPVGAGAEYSQTGFDRFNRLSLSGFSEFSPSKAGFSRFSRFSPSGF